MKILLADKDTEVLEVTTYALRRYGFEVIAVRDGVQALRCWKEAAPDLVLLEIDLPQLNGFDLCREIRQHSSTPVIMVSARTNDEDVVQGFHFGADDYVAKPINHRQLAMRIRAILNRTSGVAGGAFEAGELRAGKLRLDIESHEVIYGVNVVRLTPIEFRIFYMLMLNVGRVVSTERLIEYAWGYGDRDSATLKMHVSRIRQKLALHGSTSDCICSIRWVGYMLKDAELGRGSRISARAGSEAGYRSSDETYVRQPP
jgi:DNA-binding response OmpR family regulator